MKSIIAGRFGGCGAVRRRRHEFSIGDEQRCGGLWRVTEEETCCYSFLPASDFCWAAGLEWLLGAATMGAVSIGAAGVQIAHVATTVNRSDMTLLPIVIGALIVAAMLLGALTRRPSQSAAA